MFRERKLHITCMCAAISVTRFDYLLTLHIQCAIHIPHSDYPDLNKAVVRDKSTFGPIFRHLQYSNIQLLHEQPKNIAHRCHCWYKSYFHEQFEISTKSRIRTVLATEFEIDMFVLCRLQRKLSGKCISQTVCIYLRIKIRHREIGRTESVFGSK